MGSYKRTITAAAAVHKESHVLRLVHCGAAVETAAPQYFDFIIISNSQQVTLPEVG